MNIYAVTIGFTPARILARSWDQVYKTIGLKPTRHILLDNNYPKDKFKNSCDVHMVCQEFGAEYYNLGDNIGLAAGYNWLIDKCNAEDEDIIIGLDPDVWPVTDNWARAMVDVLQADERVGWASLNVTPHTAREMSERGGRQLKIAGHVVQECEAACMTSIGAWSVKMLKDLGGLSEPRKYYGGIESYMRPKLKLLNWRWVYCMDYKEEWNEAVACEEDYKEYKQQYVAGKTKDSFEQWLYIQQQ